MNSNFEGWYLQNQDKSYRDFEFSFSKMSKSGPLFDLEKVINISKNYLSKLKAEEVYDNALTWSLEYDKEFAKILQKYKDYTIDVLNIERNVKKPRKDFSCYSEIKSCIWYMYDELFDQQLQYNFDNIKYKKEIATILKEYLENYYNENDDKDTWFNKMKQLADKLGYASDIREYKENPTLYKGNISDVANVIRVAVTTSNKSPDLYMILKLLGRDRIEKRFSIFY